MKGKYIVFLDSTGMEVPVVFPVFIEHKTVQLAGAKPIRAGFVSIYSTHEIYTTGKSLGLELDSHPDDAELIKSMFKPQ